ncbi:MAG: hypothetical protein RL215_1406 [Planctomycetota bacterium]
MRLQQAAQWSQDWITGSSSVNRGFSELLWAVMSARFAGLSGAISGEWQKELSNKEDHDGG